MSDAVQVALITGITATVPPLIVGVLNYLNGRKRDRTVGQIHTLVNSQMGEQLRIGMVAARTLANVTKTKENNLLASEAEKKYADHQGKQATVDAA